MTTSIPTFINMPSPTRAGYSGKPTAEKLGIKSGMTITIADGDARVIAGLGLPADVAIKQRLTNHATFILQFVTDKTSFDKKLASLAKSLAADGTLWISWPKKSSPLFKDLTEDMIREAALKIGLVDVKVCAVDDNWSGLKLMVRKEWRATWGTQ